MIKTDKHQAAASPNPRYRVAQRWEPILTEAKLSGKGGTQADSNGARKKTSAPSVHDARKVSCPLILLGSVSARAPDFLHLNQASGRSDRSAIGPPTRARVIAQLLRRAVRWRGPFSELRFGKHPRACGNNPRTLLPGMRRQRMAAAD